VRIIERQGLKGWWDVIFRKESRLLEDDRGPLVYLRGSEEFFGLRRLPPLRFAIEADIHVQSESVAFKHLSATDIRVLRKNMFAGSDTNITARWAETLMRFCEVRHSTLKQRAVAKWGSEQAAQLSFLEIAAFLLDYYYCTKDIRFVNTVLKLADSRWILQEGRIHRNLFRGGRRFLSALFQVRLLLMTECAIRRLDGDWMQ